MKKSQRTISRKGFLRKAALGTSGAILLPNVLLATHTSEIVTDKKKPLKPAMVKEFVRVSHSKFDKVKAMLEQEPGLIHSAWDWGGGDFERPIEAAAHMGNQEIIKYLLSKGARMSIFVAAVMGNLDLVKTILQYSPEQLHVKGAHKLSLMYHAKRGGNNALPIVKYLKSFQTKK